MDTATIVEAKGHPTSIPEPMMPDELLAILKKVKQLYGWSKEGLGDYIGTDMRTLRRWELREHPIPRSSVIAMRALIGLGVGKLNGMVIKAPRNPA